MTDQNQNAADTESEDAENETEEFELEGMMTHEEGAAVLRELADHIEAGSVELGDGEEPVSVPEQFEVEFEYEEGDDEAELEIELEWPIGDDKRSPTTESDTDDGEETVDEEVGEAETDDEEVSEVETDDED
ncbi:amphi-Trp domain-containing protein [Halalkalirubrum salinum]|uniref:amphi-Trp domain-containing protein n=1 Tax=Halalkalirubrum salinum TaxID=2563889 RepID=UPI00197ADCBC|nr:amphi-Trp domain-containing protein [Halalkalirubrum salinum]